MSKYCAATRVRKRLAVYVKRNYLGANATLSLQNVSMLVYTSSRLPRRVVNDEQSSLKQSWLVKKRKKKHCNVLSCQRKTAKTVRASKTPTLNRCPRIRTSLTTGQGQKNFEAVSLLIAVVQPRQLKSLRLPRGTHSTPDVQHSRARKAIHRGSVWRLRQLKVSQAVIKIQVSIAGKCTKRI